MLFEGNERKELERKMLAERRLPPGQAATLKWPVLHYGSVPRFDPSRWDFRIRGLVEQPARLGWDEFNRLPKTTVTSDFHCVTRWSRFDNRWEGVLFREVLSCRVRRTCWFMPSRDIQPISRLPTWIATTFCSPPIMMASRSRPNMAIPCG